jgi:hypothetical protein
VQRERQADRGRTDVRYRGGKLAFSRVTPLEVVEYV